MTSESAEVKLQAMQMWALLMLFLRRATKFKLNKHKEKPAVNMAQETDLRAKLQKSNPDYFSNLATQIPRKTVC